MKKIALKVYMILLLFSVSFSFSQAACDCGSTDTANPCTGNNLEITVTDTGANGGDLPAVFNWEFSSGGDNVRCGQFANGDYWIAPANGQDSVTINSVTGSDSISVDADPLTGKFGLLSGAKNYSGYDVTEKLTFPSNFSSVTSLVAAIQRDEADPLVAQCGTAAIEGECVDAYNVVTILETVPANCGADMIRPNITGATKEFLTLSDFDLTRLPNVSYLNGTNAAVFESIRQRWSHSIEIFSLGFSTDGGVTFDGNSEAGRAFRSHILIDDYAAGAAARLHSDLAILFSDDNLFSEKKSALAAILSYGLDIYHARYNPPAPYSASWGSGAGQHLGKFSSVVLLSALEKNNPTRLNMIKDVASYENKDQPQELAQIHEGPNGPVWGDGQGPTRYWNDYSWSGCYDTAPEHIAYDYWTWGEWKTMNFPIGEYYTGLKHFVINHSNWDGMNGDLKLRNISLNGAPIDLENITFVNYTGTSSSGTIADGVLSVLAGDTFSKRTEELYEINEDSVLSFDFYQSSQGWSIGIGFDEDDISNNGLRLVQITGVNSSSDYIQLGCNPSVGKKTAADPYKYIDGPANLPGSSYFGIGYGGILNFSAVMLIMPEFYEAVNTTKSIDFVNRARTHGLQTLPDPCVNQDTRESKTCDIWGGGVGCYYYYPTASISPTWGPKSLIDSSLGCADVEILPFTKAGRFASLDGTPAPISMSYTSGQLYNNWDLIKEAHDSASFRADVDNSGGITTADALLTLRNSLGLDMNGTAWQVGVTTGDVNCDNLSNSADALLILRYSLGLGMEETSWCE